MSKEEYKQFKAEFWLWFDSLHPTKKRTFWYHKDDLAETNFYFTTYMKQKRAT